MKSPAPLRGRIAQLIFVRFGSNMKPKVEASDDFDRVAKLLDQQPLGGLLFFNGGTAEQSVDSLQRIQSAAAIPLTIAADMERGLAQQITDLTTWPHALAFDALGKEAASIVEEFARLSAAEARQIGVHISFSPVADIHRNPDNPIIANRAFGTAASRVSQLAAAYVRGCHTAGLLCCGKHFPGHGNTQDDSHAGLPVVDESLEQLLRTDLKPFRELVGAGVDLMMTAHVAFPALDATGVPATLSRPILTSLLRDEWGFRGAVVTDSLQMAGVNIGGRTEGEVAVAAIKAGVDLLLDVSDVVRVIDAIELAANEDSEFAQRVAAAFDRVWAIKQKAYGMKPESLTQTTSPADHALQVARNSLKVIQSDNRIQLPLGSAATNVGFLLVNPMGDNAYTKTNHIVELFASFDCVQAVHVLELDAVEAQADQVLANFGACDACVVALVVKPSAWQASQLPEWQRDLVNELSRNTPTVLAALGIEELLYDFPNAAVKIVTNSDVPVCQSALVEVVMGTTDASLKLGEDRRAKRAR
jgi:beta-glucosidase-like glycosyl hydrolase